MRICTICKINPPRNKTSSYCKSCHNTHQKKYYKEHPESIRQSLINRRKRARELVIKAKDKPCLDCGIKYPSYVMDFDHKGKKNFNISVSASQCRSLSSIQKEIDKCEVVCANCHRMRTFKDANLT